MAVSLLELSVEDTLEELTDQEVTRVVAIQGVIQVLVAILELTQVLVVPIRVLTQELVVILAPTLELIQELVDTQEWVGLIRESEEDIQELAVTQVVTLSKVPVDTSLALQDKVRAHIVLTDLVVSIL